MKTKIFTTLIVAIIAVFGATNASAQEKASVDSTATVIKLRTLNQKKDGLAKRIAAEDKKRGQIIDGVSPVSMERINLVQDSICLELRSELVSVELEIKELTPNATANNIIQQFNNLQNPQPAKKEKD